MPTSVLFSQVKVLISLGLLITICYTDEDSIKTERVCVTAFNGLKGYVNIVVDLA